ncbi:hypothetical protein DMENIID0001_115990 [Sergentomyia squamirostris]
MSPDLNSEVNATETTNIGSTEITKIQDQDQDPKFSDSTAIVDTLSTDFTFQHKIVWKNVIAYSIFHIFGLVGTYMAFSVYGKLLTSIFALFTGIICGLGLTVGAHRLFTHKAFKATIATRRVLMLMFILNGQNSLWEWIRDHRQHHKYSDTDADPHNASRGFFFSHVGWLLSRKHPLVFKYGKDIDMSDIEADSWIMFQKKHFLLIYVLISILLPCIVPVLLWNERPLLSLLIMYFGRATVNLNATWSINSLAHISGMRPYDKKLFPVQNKFVSFITLGEGWHNYHHAFPWDYRSAEFNTSVRFATTVIDFCAKRGWIYDLKFAKEESVKRRIVRTGDNSHPKYGNPDEFKGTETLWNFWNSPSNPTYRTKDYKPGPITITREGYVLFDNEKKVK